MRNPRFLLIQCRESEDPMGMQERDCFREGLRCNSSQFTFCNIPYESPSEELLKKVDIVLVGGSGDYSVLDDVPWLPPFFRFLRLLYDTSFPMFASCFGFQALTIALGGNVIHDHGRAEVGTYELKLSDQGKCDPLFSALPEKFLAQMGHKDRAVNLPEEAINLAFSELCPYQAYKIKDKPIYATQFHPELTMQRNRERFLHYMDKYTGGKVAIETEKNLASLRETPETSQLLANFVRHMAHWQK